MDMAEVVQRIEFTSTVAIGACGCLKQLLAKPLPFGGQLTTAPAVPRTRG
jgi:hypothetical protein